MSAQTVESVAWWNDNAPVREIEERNYHTTLHDAQIIPIDDIRASFPYLVKMGSDPAFKQFVDEAGGIPDDASRAKAKLAAMAEEFDAQIAEQRRIAEGRHKHEAPSNSLAQSDIVLAGLAKIANKTVDKVSEIREANQKPPYVKPTGPLTLQDIQAMKRAIRADIEQDKLLKLSETVSDISKQAAFALDRGMEAVQNIPVDGKKLTAAAAGVIVVGGLALGPSSANQSDRNPQTTNVSQLLAAPQKSEAKSPAKVEAKNVVAAPAPAAQKPQPAKPKVKAMLPKTAKIPTAAKVALEKAVSDAPESLDVALFAGQQKVESNFRTNAESQAGAQGPAQFLPRIWAAEGVDGNNDGKKDPTDPADAAAAQVAKVNDLIQWAERLEADVEAQKDNINELEAALMAYNWGQGNVGSYVRQFKELPSEDDAGKTFVRNGKERIIPEEAVEYADKVLEAAKDFGYEADESEEDDGQEPEIKPEPVSQHADCAPGTTNLGIHETYKKGHKTDSRLCAIPGLPGSGSESTPGKKYYIEGANGNAIIKAELSADALAMVEAAKADGIDLTTISSFRTHEHQQDLCQANDGCRNGSYKAVAKPGRSGHQGAEALDFADSNQGRISNCVGEHLVDGKCVAPDDERWVWLNENADKFGFNQYKAESWHFDRRGAAHADKR